MNSYTHIHRKKRGVQKAATETMKKQTLKTIQIYREKNNNKNDGWLKNSWTFIYNTQKQHNTTKPNETTHSDLWNGEANGKSINNLGNKIQ